MNSTRIRQHINAPRASVDRALLDERAIAKWKVPTGLTSHSILHALLDQFGSDIMLVENFR